MNYVKGFWESKMSTENWFGFMEYSVILIRVFLVISREECLFGVVIRKNGLGNGDRKYKYILKDFLIKENREMEM